MASRLLNLEHLRIHMYETLHPAGSRIQGR